MSDQEEIQARALAVLNVDGKIEAVRKLAEVQRRRAELVEELEAVERVYGAEHVAAVRVGWSEQELGKLGFEEPTRRPKGRPRGRSRGAGSAVAAGRGGQRGGGTLEAGARPGDGRQGLDAGGGGQDAGASGAGEMGAAGGAAAASQGVADV